MNNYLIRVSLMILISCLMSVPVRAEQNKPLLTLRQAMDLDKHDKHDEAVAAIKRIIEQNPKQDMSQAYFCLGLVYFRNEHFSSALDGFLKSIELNKENPATYYFMGMIYEKKALGTSKPEIGRDMKVKALEAWQNYLKYADSKKTMPSNMHWSLGITVKESIKRAKNHVEMLQEGLQ